MAIALSHARSEQRAQCDESMAAGFDGQFVSLMV
jgi:hypothetical protein